MRLTKYFSRGFTLIELLIVVAIIAILAAIAVPNFLEAQTRAKVSRCAADMRSIRTAIESYYVDHNRYFETDFGVEDFTQIGVGMIRITTPISYMSSIPISPFQEDNIGGGYKNANKYNIYLWVNAKYPTDASGNIATVPGATIEAAVTGSDYDKSFNQDRQAYLAGGVLNETYFAVTDTGLWMLKSVGPNNEDDRSTLNLGARIYDPTNGTISSGDIVVFSDRQGLAGQN